MKNIFINILNSFKNNTLGYSGRKLSAFASVLTGIVITLVKLPSADQLNALYAWLLFALLCLGIVTIQNIIEFKNGIKNDKSE
jgi:hypothetical protein